jgi:hypothetical protein
MNVTEATMQAVLMRWLMGTMNHELVIPNSTTIFYWEADLVSVTKSHFTHEYEIKLNMADFRRDAKKENKHFYLTSNKNYTPNYFWYATWNFDIDPPDHAGWLKVTYTEKAYRYFVDVKKPAPRLHKNKISDDKRFAIGRLLSWRLTNMANSVLFATKAR